MLLLNQAYVANHYMKQGLIFDIQVSNWSQPYMINVKKASSKAYRNGVNASTPIASLIEANE